MFESNRSPAIRNEVDLLGDREVDGGAERGELPLALGRRLLAEVVVAGAEMDVGGVDESAASGLWRASLVGRAGRCATRASPGPIGPPERPAGPARARRPHDSPLAAPNARRSL